MTIAINAKMPPTMPPINAVWIGDGDDAISVATNEVAVIVELVVVGAVEVIVFVIVVVLTIVSDCVDAVVVVSLVGVGEDVRHGLQVQFNAMSESHWMQFVSCWVCKMLTQTNELATYLHNACTRIPMLKWTRSARHRKDPAKEIVFELQDFERGIQDFHWNGRREFVVLQIAI
jgi:hypothetical protein